MDIILFGVLAMVVSLVTLHYILKRRRKKYNRIRLKRLAGNVTGNEQAWFHDNESAKYTNKQRFMGVYNKVRYFPTEVKKKIEERKKVQERIKVRDEARAKIKRDRQLPHDGSINDGTPIKLTNIANEIRNPSGISNIATDKEFLSVADSEEGWFQSVPPTRA